MKATPLAAKEYLGLSPTAWDVIASITTAVGVFVGAVALLYAASQYALSRQVFREQTRPYLVVSCQPGLTSNHIADLVVRNIGTTPARRVSIKIDPPFERAKETRGYELSDARLFNEPTDMWPPGYEVRAFLDSHIDRADRPELPKSHRVTVTYSDGKRGQWQEEHVLDLAMMEGLMWGQVYGLHHAAKALREIASTVKLSEVLKKGRIDATVESRGERESRVSQQNEAARGSLAELRDKLIPGDRSD